MTETGGQYHRNIQIVFDSHYRYSRGYIKERYWLSKREIELLYNSCEQGKAGDFDRAMLSIYYGLGLRRMEGVGLDLSDIQRSSGLIYVRKAKFGKERFVPIGNRVQYDLDNYSRRYRKQLLKKVGNQKEKALLVSEKGNRISGNAVYYNLQRLAEKAGIKTPISLHSLRHSLATHLMENGLDLESIAVFLGHTSLESTQIYTHLVHQKSY